MGHLEMLSRDKIDRDLKIQGVREHWFVIIMLRQAIGLGLNVTFGVDIGKKEADQ